MQARHRHSLTRGFTLLELMVVITLIAIMSAVIIPEMKGTYEDALLRASSRELISVLNLASSRAVAVNQIHRVRLDREVGRYVLERCARERGAQTEFVPVRDGFGNEANLDSRIKIDILKPETELPGDADPAEESDDAEASASIRFYPDGTADARQIVLTDRDGIQAVFRTNPATGRVRPVELEPRE